MKSARDWEATKERLTQTIAHSSWVVKGQRYMSDVPELVEEIESLLGIVLPQNDNLSAVQKRCTELLDEVRAQRWFKAETPTARVVDALLAERYRQDLKWGPLIDGAPAVGLPDGTGGSDLETDAINARHQCEMATSRGRLTWQHILSEEVAEALAEKDPALLRAELVQVGAVCLKWLEAIERRGAP